MTFVECRKELYTRKGEVVPFLTKKTNLSKDGPVNCIFPCFFFHLFIIKMSVFQPKKRLKFHCPLLGFASWKGKESL